MFVWNGTSWEVISGNGTVTSVQVAGGTTGLTYSGGPITGAGTITTAGTLAVANGGTALTALGTAGQVLAVNAGATALEYTSDSGGSVTSVAVSGGTTGLTTSGGPITGSGTITFAGTLAVANGGTGVTTSTGTGAVVLSTSPTLVTPALGTPASGVLTNTTGLPLTTGVTGTLPVANGGTGATSLTVNNVVLGNGTSAVQVVAPSTSGNILTSNGSTWQSTAPAGGGNSLDFVAADTLASGQAVALKADGNVTAVAETIISPDAPIGSPTLVDGNNTEYVSIAADPFNENRWVATYTDDIGNKNLYMKVFTRSGTTITQSSPITVIAGIVSDCSVVFDRGQENVVLLMYSKSSSGNVVVATISGSAGSESVSLGTALNFYSGSIYMANQLGCISLVCLDTSGNFMGIWVDANSSDGTVQARIFQVSGTGVTAGGSNTNLATDVSTYSDATRAIRRHYSDATKVYFAYKDTSATLAMKLLTVSGTTISIGTQYQTSSTLTAGGVSINPISATKIIVASRQNTGGYPFYVVVTDDGSGGLSYGTLTVVTSVNSSNAIALNNQESTGLVFPFYYSHNAGSGRKPFIKILTSNADASTITLSAENQIDTNTVAGSFVGVATQEDSSGHYLWLGEISSDLYYILGKAGGASTNFTDFVGITDAAISSGATGSVTVLGGISETLSSLSPNVNYYVQDDGTITTTVSTELAGLALSSTKILLKGTS
jgi:hypothetical protein